MIQSIQWHAMLSSVKSWIMGASFLVAVGGGSGWVPLALAQNGGAIAEPISVPRRPQTAPAMRITPMNPMVLRRAYDDMTREYRQIETILGQIDPRDQRLVETLKAQREGIAEQLHDVMAQFEAQGLELPSPAPTSLRAEIDKATGEPQESGDAEPKSSATEFQPNVSPNVQPRPRPRADLPPSTPIPTTTPRMPFPGGPGDVPRGEDFARAPNPDPLLWNAPAPSQRTLDEIAALRGTIESLRSEVAALREEIKTMTIQLQLLTRSVAASQAP